MQGLPKAYSKMRLVRFRDNPHKMYGIGIGKFRDLAKDAGAIIKIGTITLIDLDRFEKYLETFRVDPDEYY